MLQQFLGTGVAMITPFTASGQVDYAAMENMVNYLIEGGVEYLVILGTTGESVTLEKQEKQEIYRFAVKINAGRVPMMAGLGGNYTAEVLKNIAEFDFTGYQAILSVCPYYNKPNQQGIISHYKKVADACPVPVILYNVPGRTGVNMTPETTLELTKHPNIAGMKEASGNMEQCMQIALNKPDDFLLISGDDNLTLPFISIGMQGVISVIANAYPREFSDSVRHALAGNFTGARQGHYKLLELMKLIFADGSPGGIKAILSQMGLCQEIVREPLALVGPAVKEKITAEMRRIS